MQLADVVLALFAALGHLGLALAVANRINAVGWNRHAVKTAERVIYAIAGLTLLWMTWRVYQQSWNPSAEARSAQNIWFSVYFFSCVILAIWLVAAWFYRQFLRATPAALVHSETRLFDIQQRIGHRPVHGLKTQLMSRLPLNQVLQLQIHRRHLQFDRLPASLHGLTITHLSDLHLTGRIGKPFFQEIVDLTNELDSDLVMITGDIFDSAKCIDWVPETLAKLRARHGIFYILGNHDLLTKDIPRVRQSLAEAGFSDLGGLAQEICIRGEKLLLAGNERPWIRPSDESQYAVLHSALGSTFRILLTHSPDQIRWARKRAFDLVLAGHTHGGQIRFPWVGPIVCPSLYGVHYASGLFQHSPCITQVVRGVSSKTPLRINCCPEIVQLTLLSAAMKAATSE